MSQAYRSPDVREVETGVVDEVDHAGILKFENGGVTTYHLNLYGVNGERLDTTDDFWFADLFPGIECSGDTIRDPVLYVDGDDLVLYHEINSKDNDVLEDPQYSVQRYQAYVDLGDVEIRTDIEPLVGGEIVSIDEVPELPEE